MESSKQEPIKLKRTSVSEQIFAILKGKIASGEWKDGQKIPSENELAAQFGVRSIPTLMMFKAGEVADMKVGAAPKTALSSWISGNV